MQNYSTLDKFLHTITLSSSFMSEMQFDFEKALHLKQAQTLNLDRPVFITGLARAGTTILMRALHETAEFASLTYDDMPFVMAPNFWAKLSGRHKKERILETRAHGDGILVDYDSPEALEEVFWRTFLGDSYITAKSLKKHSITEVVAEEFDKYQALICQKYKKNRYLSKNNNHILRLKSLTELSSNPIILVPFRSPLHQARSLRTQHEKFLNSPPFVRNYMTWLVHHEFGATHRPFQFSQKNNVQDLHKSDNSYWLTLWCETYEHVLDVLATKPHNIYPVCYELLCRDKNYSRYILQDVSASKANYQSFVTANDQYDELDLTQMTALEEKARNIYDALCCYTHEQASL